MKNVMKGSFWCFLLVILFACEGTNVKITEENIQVVSTNKHPFLVDHERVLKVVDQDENMIDRIDLHMDSGSGAESFLFKEGEQFILIDCNGMWYEIDTNTGEIDNGKWKWQQNLPAVYLGTYRLANGQYQLQKEDYPSKEQVYRFKDPK